MSEVLVSDLGEFSSADDHEIRWHSTIVRCDGSDTNDVRCIVPSLCTVSAVIQNLWLRARREPSIRTLQASLAKSRALAVYQMPFQSVVPRISVIIPTHTAPDALWERAIPSALKQEGVEVDILIPVRMDNRSAVERVGRGVLGIPGGRVRLLPVKDRCRTQLDPEQRWLASGTVEFVAGLRAAKGDWIAPFAHDDEFTAGALSRLVSECRRRDLELCYGDLVEMEGRKARQVHCSDPPRLGSFGFQGSVWHNALRIFEHRESDALRNVPNDWGTMDRMLAAGVRVGHLHEVTCRYFPSRSNAH